MDEGCEELGAVVPESGWDMTLHPKRCALCALCKMELGYTNPFCTFNNGMTSMPRQLIAFISIRGCASFDAGITETVAKLEIREDVPR